MMKALILAGGVGTRLRPLTCTKPKILLPIVNKPLLDWTLQSLVKHSVKEAILAVNYKAETIIRQYGNEKYGVKIVYSMETEPLGTGGPIRKAEELLGKSEPFIVANGDILTDVNYKELMRKHEQNRDAIATIVLFRVEDPSRYGTVQLTENNRITRFVEKPKAKEAPSNLINAGIYVLDPQIFDFIPLGRQVSLEHEVFPKLAEEGKLYGYVFNGLWVDIGKPKDYLKANKLLLDTLNVKHEETEAKLGVEIVNPVLLGENVVIGERSKIGPYVVMSDNVTVGRNVLIQNSVVFNETTILDFSSINGGIVGGKVRVGRHVKILDECILGDHVVIRDDVTLAQGVTVCPYKVVSESVLTKKCLM